MYRQPLGSPRYAAILVLLAGTIGGCRQDPTVTIADPATFTVAHITAAQNAYATDTRNDPSVAQGRARVLSMGADMQRYFGASSASWASSSLRMDDMLDGTQRAESFARALSQAVDIKAAASAHATKPTSNDAKPSDPAAATAIDAADAKALTEVYGAAVSDSPFDRLERARAFFTSYVLALLRLYGADSRVINVELLNPVGAVGARQLNSTFRKGTTSLQVAGKAIDDAEAFELTCLSVPPKSKDSPRVVQGKQLGAAVRDARSQLALTNKTVTAVLDTIAEGQAGLEKARKDLADAQKIQEDKKKLDDEAATKLKGEEDTLAPLVKIAADKKKKLDEAKASGVGVAPAQAEFDASDKARADQEKKRDDAQAGKKKTGDAFTDAQNITKAKQRALDTAQEPAKAYADALSRRDEAERRLKQAETGLHDFAWQDARLTSAKAVVSEATAPAPDRLILVLIQAHVDAGNKPDMIAGIKAEVSGTDTAGNALPAEDVRVLYVHPGRTYDVADERRFDKVQQSMSVALAAQIGSVDANASADNRSREEERGRYLSRITKMSSVADAAGGANGGKVIGWYFFPSNVQIEHQLLGGYKARGYLEGGGHDCAVWISVPKAAAKLSLNVWTIVGELHEGRFDEHPASPHAVVVKLPDYVPMEHYLMTRTNGASQLPMGVLNAN